MFLFLTVIRTCMPHGGTLWFLYTLLGGMAASAADSRLQGDRNLEPIRIKVPYISKTIHVPDDI